MYIFSGHVYLHFYKLHWHLHFGKMDHQIFAVFLKESNDKSKFYKQLNDIS
jgi:hypothetical protein